MRKKWEANCFAVFGNTMSRIGRTPVVLPQGVTLRVEGDVIAVSGPKGELKEKLQRGIVVEVKDGTVIVSRKDDQPIGRYKVFINETIEGNKILFRILTRLLDSYNYESGKKRLSFGNYNMDKTCNSRNSQNIHKKPTCREIQI